MTVLNCHNLPYNKINSKALLGGTSEIDSVVGGGFWGGGSGGGGCCRGCKNTQHIYIPRGV